MSFQNIVVVNKIHSLKNIYIYLYYLQLPKIKALLSSIWAKGCILMTVCVFYLT